MIRLYSIIRISNSKDPRFDNPPAATFSAVEVNVGIVCACLPSIRPALSAILPRHFPLVPRATITVMLEEERANGHQTVCDSTRPITVGIRPYTAQSSYVSHSRTGSSSTVSRAGSELEWMHRHQAMLYGPVRQLTIIPATRWPPYTLMPPRLPMLPENLALVSPIEPPRQHARFSDSLGRRPDGRAQRHQKRLPLTPLPITDHPCLWIQTDVGEVAASGRSRHSPRT